MLKIWKTTLSNNPSMMHYSWRDTSYNWYYHSKYTSLWKPMESILLIWTWRMLVCFLETGKNLNSNNCNLQSKYLLIQVITSDWISPEAFLLEKSSSQISSSEPLFLEISSSDLSSSELSFPEISSSEKLNSRIILLRFILLRTNVSRNILLRIIKFWNYPPQKYPPQKYPQNNWLSSSDLSSSELSFPEISSSE